MKRNIIYLNLFISLFLINGCNNETYGKFSERLFFVNETDSNVYVDFKNIKDKIVDVYWNDSIDDIDNSILCVPSHYYTREIIFSDSAFSGLWMTENEFNQNVSQLTIYQIINNDTIYLPDSLYNSKSKWEYYIDRYYPYFDKYNDDKSVNNYLTVTNEMFNH